MIQIALHDLDGVEGGIWQTDRGSLAYAFPTYQGTGEKTDLPQAEESSIREAAESAALNGASFDRRQDGRSQTLLLLAYAWPGNIRELKNAIERVAILSRSDVIAASDLGFLTTAPKAPDFTAPDWTHVELPTAIARLESYMITRALQETDGNRSEAARQLGIHRQLLYSKAQKYGIDVSEPSGDETASVVNPDKSR